MEAEEYLLQVALGPGEVGLLEPPQASPSLCPAWGVGRQLPGVRRGEWGLPNCAQVCAREGNADLTTLPPSPSPLRLGSGVGPGRQRGWEHAPPPAGPGEGQTVASDQNGGQV